MVHPMLAATIDPKAIRFPVLASPKLDGVRGVVIDGVIRSRSLKTFPNTSVGDKFNREALNGLDGELIVGSPVAKDVCRVTVGFCSRLRWSPVVPEFKFYVFDDYLERGGFQQRLTSLRRRAARLKHPDIVLVDQTLVENAAGLLKYEEAALNLGFEGLILRDPRGPYKEGRSTAEEQWMMKLKRFVDSEATILAVIEEKANTNSARRNALGRTERSTSKAGLVGKDRAGALLVRDVTSGVEFTVGVSTDKDHAFFWAHRSAVVGKVIKYKSFPIGVKDSPRFPIYLGPRKDWDLTPA